VADQQKVERKGPQYTVVKSALSLVVSIVAALVVLWGPRTVVSASGRIFPDTSTRIGVLTDQLPGGMTAAQERFAATHYVGTQKLSLNLSRPLRAINPQFLVLHYHLAMWQSAPRVNYIIDGNRWSNDYDEVTRHESWFWHNPANQRVTSNQDGKLLMNVSDPGFRRHWSESLAAQVQAGDYDGVFLDSASPALLQWEARSPDDLRLRGQGVRYNAFPELAGKTWIAAWEDWIKQLNQSLASKGIPLIPNVGAFATTWDNTDYSLTAGVFCEGFFDPGLSTADWKAAMNETLSLVRQNKIVILQNYLGNPSNLAKRRYLLASYLLAKGSKTYVSYFASGSLDWYPEWTLDLGAAQKTAAAADDLFWRGVYRRDFAKGLVLVNPDARPLRIDLGGTFKRVEPEGGGAVGPDGTAGGRVLTTNLTTIEIPGKSAEILLR
jgi:hypothetical protein